MDIDLDTFLQQEKQRLLAEKQRLSARSTITANAAVHCNNNNNENSNCNARAVENEVECAAVRMMQSMRNLNEIKCNRSKNSVLDKELLQQAIQRVAERHNNSNNNNNSIKEDNNILQNCHQADVNELVVSASKTECASTAVPAAAKAVSSLATVGSHYTPVSLPPPSNSQCMPNADVLDFYHYFAKDIDKENASSAPGASINGDVANESMPENPLNNAMLVGDDEWGSKSQKELANQKELKSLNINEGKARTQQELNTLAGLRKKGNKDDMEQWVSDTFYSYFPGFNNEYQKRQNYLQERQREYQQNLLKHQQMTSNSVKPKNAYASHDANTLPTTARSNATTTTTTNSSATDKTDLEIIVNNPNYTPKYNNFAHNARPGSTRHKLLQDLRHTELSNIVTGDGVTERNRQSAEIELARKKDYQRELMQQIEEKRRSVELLREKERRQEEALTRRLQEQLKTMQLEEELEKEKLRVEKLRFNTEQNRIMREQLLAKLENDGKLLNSHKGHKKVEIRSEQASGKSSSLDSHQSDANNNNNKVYKYFSNSARHEYRRGQPLPANVDLDLDLPDSLTMPQDAHTERECFHLSDKVCPMCDAPLRSYESCCLRCQRKLSLKMTQAHGSNAEGEAAKSMQTTTATASAPMAVAQSYSLVCSKCERLYALCSSCLAKSDVCRACHRERNVCMNCRRSLCSFCLEEIASGRDVEQSHVNEQQRQQQSDNKNEVNSNEKKPAESERSFKVLDVKYNAEPLDDNEAAFLSSNQLSYNNNNNTTIFNSNKLTNKHPPYSINIERNSIFHPDYEPSAAAAAFAEQLPKVLDKNLSFDLDSSSFTHPDAEENLERVRKETDRRLSRYVKNYGDLTIKHQRSLSESRDRSTQTTPHTAARRDVVLHEEHNLSMPLLREMPRMTRRETPTQLVAPSNKQRRIIDNLHRRWEIPAVQKYSISPTSPPVLTQVGAIRKQLQTERILSDDY